MKKTSCFLLILALLVSVLVLPAGVGAADITNIALGKTGTSSGRNSSSLPEGNAFDGDTATRWAGRTVSNGGMTNGSWLAVDLGALAEVSSVRINDNDKIVQMELYRSDDGENWTKLEGVQMSKASGGKDHAIYTMTFTAVRARHIKAVFTEIPISPTIWEMEVMGFFLPTYTISSGSIVGNGTVAADKQSAAAGETVTVTVTPEAGNRLKAGTLQYNGIEIGETAGVYSFAMPAEAVTLTAEFEALYSITNGTVTGDGTVAADKAEAAAGETITVTVTPGTGQRLIADSLQYNGTTIYAQNNVYSFVMPAGNVILTAGFEAIPPTRYQVTVGTITGSGTIEADKADAQQNETVTITVTPLQGYRLKENTLKYNETVVAPQEGVYSFAMPAEDVVITAEFEAVYGITNGSMTEGGTIAADKAVAAAGETVTVTVTPDAGNRLVADSLQYNGTTIYAQNNVYSFVMPAEDVVLSAAFETPVYTITVGQTQGGSVSADKEQASAGETVTLSVTPERNMQLKSNSLKYNGNVITPQGGVYSFVMPEEDVTVTAAFESLPLEQLARGKKGSSSGSNATSVAEKFAFDGDTTTRWAGRTTGNGGMTNGSWLAVDLGALADVSSVRINDNDKIAQMELYRSDDGKTWTKLEGVQMKKDSSVKDHAIYTMTFTAVRARHIKAVFTEIATSPSIWEMEVMGFFLPSYTISNGNIVGNGTVAADKTEVTAGGTVTVTVTPDEGNRLKAGTLKYNGTEIGETEGVYSFVMPEENVTLTAEFEAVYGITNGTVTGGGTIAADKAEAAAGETITVTVTPLQGYRLKENTLKYNETVVVPQEGVYSFTMPAEAVVLTAEFETIPPARYQVTVGTITGSGTIEADKADAAAGETVTVTVTPEAGNRLKAGTLKYNGIEIGETAGVYSFTMPAEAVTLTAEFEAVYGITNGTVTGGGTIAADKAEAAAGETITVTVTPGTGQRLVADSLQYNGTVIYAQNNVYSFVMPAGNVILTAGFEAIPPTRYQVTVGTVTGSGTIEADKADAQQNETVTITVTPGQGYRLKENTLKYNETVVAPQEGVYSFAMPAENVELTAEFEAVYGITNGTVTGSGTIAADKADAAAGETITVIVTPDEGYRLKAGTLQYNGTEIGETAGVYSFTMPAKAVVLTAEFESLVHTITVGQTQGGSVSADKKQASAGETVTLTVTPAQGMQLKPDSLKYNGNVITPQGGVYSFVMPEGDVTVTAAFESLPLVNLARGKTGSSSGRNSSSMPEGNAFDGDTATRWAGKSNNYGGMTNGSWLAVDLGALAEVSSVRINDNDKIEQMELYRSDDGENWTKIEGVQMSKDSSVKDHAIYTMTFTAVRARHIKAVFTKIPISPSIWEMEVMGFFLPSFTISNGSIVGNGTVAADKAEAMAGETITVTVTPEEGKRLKAGTLKYNGTEIGETAGVYSFVMPAGNVVLTAEFEEIPLTRYPVAVGTVTGSGTIKADKADARQYETVTITVTPGQGYRLKENSLKYNGTVVTPQNGIYSFAMPEEKVTLTAEFEAVYGITNGTVTGGGTIAADKAKAVAGETITVTVTPDAGKRLKAGTLKYNGTVITPQGSDYSFTMPAKAVVLTAEFEAIPATRYQVAVGTVTGSGTIKADKADALQNETVTITVTPGRGYRLKENSLKYNGTVVVPQDGIYSFAMPAADVVITAAFEPMPLEELARGKKAAGSRTFDGYPPSNAFDGDKATRWASKGQENVWLSVDLGGRADVSKVSMLNNGKIVNFVVYSSLDGENWTPVGKETHTKSGSGDATTNTSVFEPVKARFIKISFTELTNQPSIWEVEVMGTGFEQWRETENLVQKTVAEGAVWSVDLGRRMPVNQLRVLEEIQTVSGYRIERSDDGNTWTEAVSGTLPASGNANAASDINFEAVNTRYLRLIPQDAAQGAKITGISVHCNIDAGSLFAFHLIDAKIDKNLITEEPLEAIKNDIKELPRQISAEGYIADIIWSSSDENVVNTQSGIVRPGADAQSVVLTAVATVRNHGEIIQNSKTFQLTVLSVPQYEAIYWEPFNELPPYLKVENGTADIVGGALQCSGTAVLDFEATSPFVQPFRAEGPVVAELALSSVGKNTVAIMDGEQTMLELRFADHKLQVKNGAQWTDAMAYEDGTETVLRFLMQTETGTYDIAVFNDGRYEMLLRNQKLSVKGGRASGVRFQAEGTLTVAEAAVKMEAADLWELIKQQFTFDKLSAQPIVAVSQDLVLPGDLFGADVRWISSDSQRINPENGSVAPGDGVHSVTLGATVKKGTTQWQKDFLVILGAQPYLIGKDARSNAQGMPGYSAENITDGNLDTAYRTKTDKPFTITVDMQQKQTISNLIVQEEDLPGTITAYEVQVSNDKITWETVASGETVGRLCTISFLPQECQVIRFNVLKKNAGICGIGEILAVFAPGDQQIVETDREAIVVPKETTVSFPLPQNGTYGSSIIWTSSNNNVIAVDGATAVVQRPEYDLTVILNAHITHGAYSTDQGYSVTVKGTKTQRPSAPGTTGGGSGPSSGGSRPSSGGGDLPAIVPPAVQTPAPPEVDTRKEEIKGHWAEKELSDMIDRNLIQGDETGLRLDDSVSRSEFVALLVRGLGLEPKAFSGGAKDVQPDSWYADSMQTAIEAGLITGAEGMVRPDDNITREEMAAIVVRAYQNSHQGNLPEENGTAFSDQEEISSWALASVKEAEQYGLVKGFEDGTFGPKQTLSRVQAMVVIFRLMQKVGK